MDYTYLRQQIPYLKWSSQLPGVSVALRSLIHHSGSMTQRLRYLSRSTHCGHCEPVSVHVIGETLSSQALWEREVLLQVDGKTCIWAHSLIPQPLREQPLANQPLGDWVFARYQVTRTCIGYASLRCDSLTLPIRRSRLLLTERQSLQLGTDVVAMGCDRSILKPSILVIECFLPCISELLRENSNEYPL